MRWQWPTSDEALDNVWNKSPDAPLFPPKLWGIGWGYNFAYPLIKEKPLWKRVLAFFLGLLFVLLIIYVFVVLAVLIYYALTPVPTQTLTLTLSDAGAIVT